MASGGGGDEEPIGGIEMGGKRDVCISSNVITASGAAALVISTKAGFLCSVGPIITSTGDLTVIAYDNTSTGTGVKVYQRKVDVSVEGWPKPDFIAIPIAFSSGLVFTITGTAPDGAIVGFI